MPLFADVSRRNRQPEFMDRPDLDGSEHVRALRGLARINYMSRSARILLPEIRRLAGRNSGTQLRVLDLACGGGDVSISLARLAKASGIKLAVDGCDISSRALEHARRRAAEAQADVRFFECDVVQSTLPSGYDVLTCSLFLHHQDQPEAERLLKNMAAATQRLVLVNDLRRNRTAYLLACAASRILSRSSVVHADGPTSVAGAFTPDELRSLAERAGLSGATVRRKWPQRMLLAWSRP